MEPDEQHEPARCNVPSENPRRRPAAVLERWLRRRRSLPVTEGRRLRRLRLVDDDANLIRFVAPLDDFERVVAHQDHIGTIVEIALAHLHGMPMSLPLVPFDEQCRHALLGLIHDPCPMGRKHVTKDGPTTAISV